MAATPMDIQKRPFAVEPVTKVMMPDGIFDTALFNQEITCYYTNISTSTLNNVTIYLESIGDPGIVVTAKTATFREIPAGASVRVSWLANFELATPGKKLVSFVAKANGMDSKRTIKQIFVSSTRYDPMTKEFTCEIGEGTFRISNFDAIGPRRGWVKNCDDDRETKTGPWVPKRMSVAYYPNPGYEGVHGELPFGDPWWKIIAFIVAAIAAIVSVVAAALGSGTAGVGVSGTFEETDPSIDCCKPDPGAVPGDDGYTVAGVASVVATTALTVGLSDAADPWWRGQEATPPKEGEVTIQENVDFELDFPSGALTPGTPYPVDVTWTYQRITTGNTYTHSVTETQMNTHVSHGVEVIVPDKHNAFQSPLVIQARFYRDDDKPFYGSDLYAFALLRSPDDYYIYIDLKDDGIDPDEKANDGTYTGSIYLEEAYGILLEHELRLEGTWRVYVFAQDVNNATPDMLPEVAATHIGGFMVASAIDVNFNPALPCPLRADATVDVYF